ncbi:MAG: helix-turn-helix domain-containing protein [Polyangiaceae bacterium]
MIQPVSSSLVGLAIRTRREDAGLSLARAARESGVSIAQLSAIESGRTKASITVLGCVAQTLGSTLADLVRGAGQAHRAAPVGVAPRLRLPDIARAISELPDNAGSKIHVATSAAVLYAMKVSDENQSAAARLLGMHRKAFLRRLRRARRER